VPENVSIAYRGANYALGQGPQFYGIWPASAPAAAPLEWWPHTPDGWSGAWARFTSIEVPGSIVQVYEPVRVPPAPASRPMSQPQVSQPQVSPPQVSPPQVSPPLVTPAGPVQAQAQPPVAGQVPPAGQVPSSAIGGPVTGWVGGLASRLPGPGTRSIVAAGLLGIGVVLGIIGLFPAYTFGTSLAQQSFEVVPHVIYLATWTVSAVLVAIGGARLRAGALLALGMSIVTFGMFVADAGAPISAGSHVMGSGLVLSVLGWLVSTVGAIVALRRAPAGRLGRPVWHERVPAVALILAGLGAAVAFAPAWDSFTLRAGGQVQTITEGNAFSNPGAVISGDVLAMVAIAAVVIIATFWRPLRVGAALLAGAIIPLLGQVISALVQAGIRPSPEQFGFTQAQANQIGLTISSGLTAIFWVFCAFVGTMILLCAWMLTVGDSPVQARMPHFAGYPASYLAPAAAGVGTVPGGPFTQGGVVPAAKAMPRDQASAGGGTGVPGPVPSGGSLADAASTDVAATGAGPSDAGTTDAGPAGETPQDPQPA
jgi:hypothetical protein